MGSRPLPLALGREFSVADALAAGVSAGRLRHRSLEIPFRGSRLIPDETEAAYEAILRRARALASIAPPGAFFSHATAAALWGLPLPDRVLRRLKNDLDLSVLDGRRGSKAHGVRGHQLLSAMTAVRSLDGLSLTSPACTWALLGDELTLEELIEVGDALVYIPRRRGMQRGTAADAMATIDQLSAALLAGRRRGAAVLREALAHVRVGSASPAETRVRRACQRAGLPEPTLYIDVYTRDGRPIGFTEIGYPRFRVLVEYEGDHHRTDPAQWSRDIEKYDAYARAGWETVRLTARHAYPSTDPAVERVRDALFRHGWRP